VRPVNRRLSLVLPAIATLSAGCATFSDSGNVARVDDAALTTDDFQAQLVELGAPDDQPIPGDAARTQLTAWIQEQLAATADDGTDGVSADEVARRYDEGVGSSGIACINGIVVADETTAERVAGELADGADFDDLLATENLDPSLGDVGGDVGCLTSDVIAEAAEIEFVQIAASLSTENPIETSSLLDPDGEVFAWVVLSFRPSAELSPTDLENVTATVNAAARLSSADVFVDPRYGTFDASTGQVVALG
jgi:hypothetical protein